MRQFSTQLNSVQSEEFPMKENPSEQGELPRKRDDSKDHQQDPRHPAPGSK